MSRAICSVLIICGRRARLLRSIRIRDRRIVGCPRIRIGSWGRTSRWASGCRGSVSNVAYRRRCSLSIRYPRVVDVDSVRVVIIQFPFIFIITQTVRALAFRFPSGAFSGLWKERSPCPGLLPDPPVGNRYKRHMALSPLTWR